MQNNSSANENVDSVAAEGRKRVLIIGATSAMAQETAKLFARDNAKMLLVARNRERLEAVARDLVVRGSSGVDMAVADLTDSAGHEELIKRAADFLGQIDVALIAHGILGDQQAAENDMLAADEIFRANFLSYVSLLQQISKVMIQQGTGTIAVISSVAGDRGRQSNYYYGSAKAALDAFASGLRNKLFKTGVHVLTVKPGTTATPMTAHLPEGPLFATAESVGQGIYDAIKKKKDVAYLPFFWRYIMLIIKLMPEAVFKRTNIG